MDWIINEKPIGPNCLKKFIVISLIKTVDGYHHGKPPNGKCALNKSNTLIRDIKIKILLFIFWEIYWNSRPNIPYINPIKMVRGIQAS